MIDVVLKRAVEEYFSNIRVMVSFGVLFLFLPLFALFTNFFISSGTVFLPLNLSLAMVVGVILSLVFLYLFSFFISLTVYAVHRDIQTINFDTYWNTLFKDAALKIFFYYLIFAVIFYIISYAGLVTGAFGWALIVDLIIGLAVMFAPQSIVLNGSTIREGIQRSIEFWAESPVVSIVVFVVATVLLFVIFGIELLLDLAGLPGIVASVFLVLVFLVPFIEQTKSYAYLLRVDLLRGSEVSHARAPKFEHAKPLYGTRLREKPRHGSKL